MCCVCGCACVVGVGVREREYYKGLVCVVCACVRGVRICVCGMDIVCEYAARMGRHRLRYLSTDAKLYIHARNTRSLGGGTTTMRAHTPVTHMRVHAIHTTHTHTLTLRNTGRVNIKWKDSKDMQRKFFDDLAHSRGFHPTEEPSKWYSISLSDVLSKKVHKPYITSHTPTYTLIPHV